MHTLTIDELRDFSGEHLNYEINMLYQTTIRLALRQTDQVIAFALLESFGIHVVIVLNFLLNKDIRTGDAAANDYVKDKNNWRNINSKYRKELDFLFWRRNKELAHLSYERRNVKPDMKDWNSLAITREISDLIDLFIDAADESLLHPNVTALKGCFKNHKICKAITNFQSLPLMGQTDQIIRSWEFTSGTN